MRVLVMRGWLRVVLVASGMALGAPVAHGQTGAMTKWKPDLGDKFICTVSHYSDCGDWKCGGVDTIQFNVADTSFKFDDQHPSTVLSFTNVLSSHYAEYIWGPRGYDTNAITHPYNDTTFLSLIESPRMETSFDVNSWGNPTLRPFLFGHDSSIAFQGRNYAASTTASKDATFIPDIGWFLYLSGYGGACVNACTLETWNMTLIAAIKTNESVSPGSVSSFQVNYSSEILQLLSTKATDIHLSDFLGRPNRSWQFPSNDDPRDLSLMVADVPSGVYFLRVSAAGMEEVRKVVIVH